MSEPIDQSLINEEYNVWNFPEFSNDPQDEENQFSNETLTQETLNQAESIENVDCSDLPQPSLVSNSELDVLKNNLNHLIALSNQLNHKLNEKIQELDKALLKKIALLIKKQ